MALTGHRQRRVASRLNETQRRAAETLEAPLSSRLTHILYDHCNTEERLNGNISDSDGENGRGQGKLL